MSFNYTSPMLLQTGITAATFESNPPYEWGWAASGNILLFLDNWGNTDNALTVDVYWGVQTKGLAPINGNIIWKKDTLLTTTYNGSGGTTTDIPATIELPSIKSRYMKLGFALGGTTQSVDVQAYFYGRSEATTYTVPVTSTAVLTNVTSLATNVTLLAGNSLRKQAMVFNDSTSVLYLKLGTTASATSYTAQIPAGGYYELPAPVYTGQIDGIWASANGAARITEQA